MASDGIAVSSALSTVPDSTTGEISENSLSCIRSQYIQGITLTLPCFGLNRTVLDPLPLALFAPGCTYREAAIQALDASDRKWRIAYSSPSQAAVQAAVSAGLAVTVMAQSTVTKDLQVLRSDEGFPPLPLFEIRLHQASEELTAPVAKLADTIIKSLGI